jgi:corrinoid protein of di/trimethylamine methyltransferase
MKLHDAIVKGDCKTAVAITNQAVAENVDPLELVTRYMSPAMDEVGRRFECQEYIVPELLLAARAMKGSLQLIRPLLAQREAKPTGRVIIGTVKGDMHDIGKNLVVSMLEGGGFDVTDLGTDVPPERFVVMVKERNANLVCLSALLTVTMPAMKIIIDALKGAGIRDRVKVIVGGAPVTQQYAADIGADAYGENASVAVTVARKLTSATML